MPKERIHWIDIARGIGMIFVIYGHVLGSYDYRHLIYAFHMPLFFFLSGAVFNDKKYLNFWQFLLKNIKSLLIPYFIFALIMFGLWLLQIRNFNLFSPQIFRQFLGIFYGNSNNGLLVFSDVLWFLPALFMTRIIFGVINNILKNAKFMLASLVGFSILGYLMSIFLPFIKLPLGSESAITAVAFYGAGFLWFKSEKAKTIVSKYKFFLFPALLILGAFMANIDFNNYGHQIDIRLSHLNNYFFFYTAAFAGIFAWISFSIILNKNKLLEAIGRNSLILFVWHPLVFTYFGALLKIILSVNVIKLIKIFIPLIYTVVSITVILLANSLLNNLKKLTARS